MSQIFAHYTCTRVKWEQDDEGFPIEEPTEEHGWVDRYRNSRALYDSRNYVRPIVSLYEDDPILMDEVRDALDWLEGGYENNGDGTFYAKESRDPFDEPWSYSYALHFTRKFLGPKGWTEEPWSPVLEES
jgi:hypothetical protein